MISYELMKDIRDKYGENHQDNVDELWKMFCDGSSYNYANQNLRNCFLHGYYSRLATEIQFRRTMEAAFGLEPDGHPDNMRQGLPEREHKPGWLERFFNFIGL